MGYLNRGMFSKLGHFDRTKNQGPFGMDQIYSGTFLIGLNCNDLLMWAKCFRVPFEQDQMSTNHPDKRHRSRY